MRRKLGRLWRAALVGGCLAAGCERAAVTPSPPDPLLVSKKPTAGKVVPADPAQVAHREPAAPLVPPTALASAPAILKSPVVLGPDRPLPPGPQPQPVDSIKEANKPTRLPVPAIPAVRSGNSPEVTAVPAVTRRVPGPYGHAADYSWLQGVLGGRSSGQLYLRYAESPSQDVWGGHVLLDDDPRLAHFKDGAVLIVEGEILRGDRKPYPRYRLRTLSRVERQE